MAASINDKLRKYKSRFSTTLSGGIGTGTGDTITPSTVTGLPTDTAITLAFDRVDNGGTKTPAKIELIRGIINGGNFTDYVRAKDGTTEQAHLGGAVIEMVWNADDWNDMVDWGLQDHTQLGYHKTLTDANGNEWIKQTATASAVNEVTVANAATGNAPVIEATGDDTNISLNLKGKGTGTVKFWDPVSSTWKDIGTGGALVETFPIVGTFPSSAATDISKTWFLPYDLKIQSARLYLKNAGSGAGTTQVDINLEGTSIFTTKLTITETGTSSSEVTADNPTTTRSAGSKVTIDVDSVTATAPAEGYVQIKYEKV